ncbi:MAG: undecaprenyl-diphosphate phosphatase [Phycisphaerae bacterium]|jgi:undecaprenyl-diphosphatase|nr:undecaprenyl-diphosphate phosphatase [Phycisphaerae bacterium]
MDYLQAILLAIIQGLTEFLPVSSSGHLSLMQSFFSEVLGVDQKNQLLFDVAVHVGTLVSILLVFRRSMLKLLVAIRRDLATVPSEPKNLWHRPSLRLLLFVIIASIPTGAIGMGFGDSGGEEGIFTRAAGSPPFVCLMLIVTGAVLMLSRLKRRQKRGIRSFGMGGALVLGLAQGLAITPGISRSGMTISAGLMLGLRRRWCVLLSFLILVPATLGAAVMGVRKAADQGIAAADIMPILVATVISAIVGYYALRLLTSLVIRRRFHWFAYYCWALGGGFLVYHYLA